MFVYLEPNRPYNQLRLAIPCRGSRSKLDLEPRGGQSGPKPCFWDGPVSVLREISSAAKDFQALRKISGAAKGFSGAAKDFRRRERFSQRLLSGKAISVKAVCGRTLTTSAFGILQVDALDA